MKKYGIRYQRIFEQVFVLGIILFMVSCSGKTKRHEIIEPAAVKPDDISTTKDIPQSHKEFLARFLPEIHLANNGILQVRNATLDLKDSLDDHDRLSPAQLQDLNKFLGRFRIDPLPDSPLPTIQEITEKITHLLKRADIIPVKLVMAQAIIESGWGGSKFAREGNNYFGVHCYTEGCGVKPAGDDSASFYVKVYPNEMAGIKDYLWILNTGGAYKGLRETRLQLRDKGKPVDALAMAQGLGSYSIKGEEYVKMVSNIIENYIPKNTEALLTEKTN